MYGSLCDVNHQPLDSTRVRPQHRGPGWMRVNRTLSGASIRLFSSTRCGYAKQKVTKHILRDYNLTTTFRYSLLDEAPPEVQAYPWASPPDLQRLRVPPRRVKMVARECIFSSASELIFQFYC
jgi:hypothetical protein